MARRPELPTTEPVPGLAAPPGSWQRRPGDDGDEGGAFADYLDADYVDLDTPPPPPAWRGRVGPAVLAVFFGVVLVGLVGSIAMLVRSGPADYRVMLMVFLMAPVLLGLGGLAYVLWPVIRGQR